MARPLSPGRPFSLYGDKLNYAREPKGRGIDSGQMHHNTDPNGPDTGAATIQLFRIKCVPETHVLGPDDVLRSVGIGPFSSFEGRTQGFHHKSSNIIYCPDAGAQPCSYFFNNHARSATR